MAVPGVTATWTLASALHGPPDAAMQAARRYPVCGDAPGALVDRARRRCAGRGRSGGMPDMWRSRFHARGVHPERNCPFAHVHCKVVWTLGQHLGTPVVE